VSYEISNLIATIITGQWQWKRSGGESNGAASERNEQAEVDYAIQCYVIGGHFLQLQNTQGFWFSHESDAYPARKTCNTRIKSIKVRCLTQ